MSLGVCLLDKILQRASTIIVKVRIETSHDRRVMGDNLHVACEWQ